MWSSMLPQERRKALALLALVMLSGVLEAAGVASILPFMALLANPTALDEVAAVVMLREALDLQTRASFLLFSGLVVFGLLLLTNTVSAAANWLLVRFANRQGHLLSVALLAGYAARPYAFFLERNSAEMIKTVFTET
jgi:hypothetical protein